MNSGRAISERHYLLAAIGIMILVSGSLAYYYAQASSEVSTLQQAGRDMCLQAKGAETPFAMLMTNGTNILQQQIQTDNTMIASLNSSKPSGYASLIGNLTLEMGQDKLVLAELNNLTLAETTTNLGAPPCSHFGF